MIILLALASAAPNSAAAPPAAQTAARSAATVQASVRIVHAASASPKDWKEAAPGHRREILIREADGRTTRLRLIEHE